MPVFFTALVCKCVLPAAVNSVVKMFQRLLIAIPAVMMTSLVWLIWWHM